MAITSPLQMLLNSLGRIQIQIKIWVIFLFISIALKLIFLDGSALWVVALISSGTYFFIVIPILIYSILNVFKELK